MNKKSDNKVLKKTKNYNIIQSLGIEPTKNEKCLKAKSATFY